MISTDTDRAGKNKIWMDGALKGYNDGLKCIQKDKYECDLYGESYISK